MRKRKLAQNYGKVFVIFYFFKCQAVVVMQEYKKNGMTAKVPPLDFH
jgi:hypothetical protein